MRQILNGEHTHFCYRKAPLTKFVFNNMYSFIKDHLDIDFELIVLSRTSTSADVIHKSLLSNIAYLLEQWSICSLKQKHLDAPPLFKVS